MNKNYGKDFEVKPAIALRYESEVFLTKSDLEIPSYKNDPINNS